MRSPKLLNPIAFFPILTFLVAGPLSATSSTPPTSPTKFSGRALNTNKIEWTWAPKSNVHFYTLHEVPTNNLVSQTTEAKIQETGLKPNQAITRVLRAANAKGLSQATQAKTIYTQAQTPNNFSANKVSFSEAEFSWGTNGNSNETPYLLERSEDGKNFVAVSLPILETTYRDKGLKSNQAYFYRIKARNGDGISTAYTPIITIQTKKKEDVVAPSKPLGMKGDLDPTGQVFTLMWESISGEENIRYHVYRRDSLEAEPKRISQYPLSVSVFADVTEGKTYFYSVRAMDESENESPDSHWVDSSPDTNVIVQGKMVSVVLPDGVGSTLRPGGNKYGVPLDIQIKEKKVLSEGNILTNLELAWVRSDTGDVVSDVEFNSPEAVLAFNLKPGVEEATLFWNRKGEWLNVGGTLNNEERTLSTKTSYLGQFQVRSAPQPSSLLLARGEVNTPIVTPNGDGLNDRLVFSLDNPHDAPVSGSIIDLTGRRVGEFRRAVNTNAQEKTILTWTGRDNSGSLVPEGVYLYEIRGQGQTYSGTFAVANDELKRLGRAR